MHLTHLQKKKIFPIETLQFRLCVQGIDWVICMCCWCSWNVSKNMCWWMCLWLGSACEGYRVDAGNALTASRLPAVHQNRWMPLIVTVSNVLNSIIPSLSHATSPSFTHGSSSQKARAALCIHSQQSKSWFCLPCWEKFNILSWVQ